MKLNNYPCAFGVGILLSYNVVASECTFEEVLKISNVEDLKYAEYLGKLDLTAPLSYKEHKYIGYIGESKKKLSVRFTSIKRSNEGYAVTGNTTVNNKNDRVFNGELSINKSYAFSNEMINTPAAQHYVYGFSVLDYKFNEDPSLNATGVFKGKSLFFWKINNSNKVEYDEPFDGYDGSRTNQFLGTWTSFKTKKVFQSNWGIHRIPCSDDLDIGTSEFVPDPKYYNVGWRDYSLGERVVNE